MSISSTSDHNGFATLYWSNLMFMFMNYILLFHALASAKNLLSQFQILFYFLYLNWNFIIGNCA